MARHAIVSAADHRFELDQLRGRPDGPIKYIEALGMEVPTYLDPRKDMWGGTNVQGVLMYHVPLKFRGPYKILATQEIGPHGERKDGMNFCLCMAVNKGVHKNINGKGGHCMKRATNYSGLCGLHGGALHPLDKSDPKEDTREAQFKLGKLPVEDMDQEELARGQVRRADGTWTNYRMIPAAVHQKCQAELFKRADVKLRENLLQAVDTMAEIAKGNAYEPEVRIRAASWIFERVRGKNPDIVVHTQDKPFEVMMADMVLQGGSRAASRAARAIESTIEAEVVPEPEAVSYTDTFERAESSELGDAWRLDPPLTPEEKIGHNNHVHWNVGDVEEPGETTEQAIARLKKARNQARAKRYASRAKGLNHVEAYPYTWKNKDSEEGYPDPEDPEYEIPYNEVKFTAPELKEVSRETKAEDTRRRRRMGRL